MIKKEITKKKSIKISLALIAVAMSMLLACPSNDKPTKNGGEKPTDTTAPSFNANLSVPVAKATDFPANSKIILTYSEAVLVGTGSITLTPPMDGTPITIAVGSAQVSVSGAVVTIDPTDDPTDDLELSTDYTLTIPSGAFMDAAGNKTAELTLSFTTAGVLDDEGPMVIALPNIGVNDFLVGENILLKYNEAVQVGTGDITLRPIMPAGPAITIDVTGTQVSITGRIVTINPPADLELSTEYTLTVPVGAIVDASGNEGSGFILDFGTAAVADTTLPTVESSVPAQNGMLTIGADIVLSYSEAVQRGTGSITITSTSGSGGLLIPVTDTVQVRISGAVVTIDPSNDLAASTAYTLTVPAGAFTDTSGNSAAKLTLSFTTLETTPPTFISSVPAADAPAFNASSNIVLTYNEDVRAGSGNITLTPTTSGSSAPPLTIDVTTGVSFFGATVTINPITDLAVSTTYALSIPAGAIQDLATNDAAVLDLSFTTAADINPVVISSMPVAGATDFRADDNIVLTFSEVVRGTTLRIITITPMGGGTPLTVRNSPQVIVGGSDAVVTINPSADLELNTQYVLTIPADAFNYASGRPNAEITLSFTTAAVLAPRVISSVPAEAATLIGDPPTIVLTFNEAVQKGTGMIRLDVSDGHDEPTFDVADNTLVTISGGGTVVTINLGSITFETDFVRPYVLTVPAAAFVDEDGNNLAEDYTLSFER